MTFGPGYRLIYDAIQNGQYVRPTSIRDMAYPCLCFFFGRLESLLVFRGAAWGCSAAVREFVDRTYLAADMSLYVKVSQFPDEESVGATHARFPNHRAVLCRFRGPETSGEGGRGGGTAVACCLVRPFGGFSLLACLAGVLLTFAVTAAPFSLLR